VYNTHTLLAPPPVRLQRGHIQPKCRVLFENCIRVVCACIEFLSIKKMVEFSDNVTGWLFTTDAIKTMFEFKLKNA